MEQTKIMKGLQTKLLHLNTELDTVRAQKNELETEHERVKALLTQSNHELQLKNKQLQKGKEAYLKLKEQNEVLGKNYRSSQSNRKALFDHLFVDTNVQFQAGYPHINSNLESKLKELNNQFVVYNYQEFERIINERNSEVKKISKQYNELMKQFLKSSNEYQHKVFTLKEENAMLKRNHMLKDQIEAELKKYKNTTNMDELALNNITLEQRIDLLVERLKLSQTTIQQLHNQLQQSKRKEEELKVQMEVSKNNKNLSPEVEKMLEILIENKKLKEQIDQSNQRYEKLVVDFPNIAKSQDQIISLVQKWKTIHDLELKSEQKTIKIQQLQTIVSKVKQENIKIQKQFRQRLSQYEGDLDCYKKIMNKFKEFFILVNPYFDTYEYSQLNLSEQELNFLKRGKTQSQQASSKVQISKLEERLTSANLQVQLHASEIAKLKAIIDKQTKKILQVQVLNEKLSENLREGSEAGQRNLQRKQLELMLQSFNKIQQQRNLLKLELRNRDIKIIELKVQLQYLKEREQTTHTAQMPSDILPEINYFCRPSILWINFNKDIGIFVKKLQQFENNIKETQKNYSSTLKQIKNEYESQLIKLKEKIYSLELQTKQKPQAILPQEQRANNMQEQGNQQQPINEAGTILDLDQQLIRQQSYEEQPINALSPQSIQQMSKVLTSHETNLKNMLEAYNELKIELENLKQKQKNELTEDYIARTKKDFDRCIEELKLVKSRLQQSDNNLVTLQNEIASKTQEFNTYKKVKEQEIQNLNTAIQQLNKEIELTKQQNYLQKPQFITKPKLKNYFPEEIQYLVELVLQKHTELSTLKKQQSNVKPPKKEPQLPIQQNKKSEELISKERQQLERLIGNGELLESLKLALDHMRDQQ